MCIRSGKPSQLIYSGASLPNRPCQKISNTALRGRKKPPGTTSQNSTPETGSSKSWTALVLPPRNLTHYTLCYIQKNLQFMPLTPPYLCCLRGLFQFLQLCQWNFIFFALLVQLVILESFSILKVLPSRLIPQ